MAKQKIYPFAVASIRAMENSLFTKQKMLQMADAKNMDDAMRIFADSAYGKHTVKDHHDFGEMIHKHLEETYQGVSGLIPGEALIDIFLYKNDFHNIKVLLKEEVSEVDGKDLLSESGTVPIDDLRKSLRERNYIGLSHIDGHAVEEAVAMYAKTKDSRHIDIILDKAYLGAVSKASKEMGHDYLIRYVELIADIHNLKIALRIKNSRRSIELFEEAILPGGGLSKNELLRAFRGESLVVGFKDTPYGEFCEKHMELGFTKFEKACDDYLMNYIKDAKYKTMTIEPIMGFILAKQMEAISLRIILTCKLHDVAPEVIRERVREAYV